MNGFRSSVQQDVTLDRIEGYETLNSSVIGLWEGFFRNEDIEKTLGVIEYE